MMEVQKFIKQHGLDELQKQFAIIVTDYPDRIVLNYNQIESPRFHPIVDECRALILRKGTWEVMARSFNRFYNLGEGVDPKMGLETQRIANSGIQRTPTPNDTFYRAFDIRNAIIQDKLDGSLLTLYWDGKEWCVSTRKLAFAEGGTNLGRTFKDVFMEAISKTEILPYLKRNNYMEDFCYVFELTGPENRVVTAYFENKITLIGARSTKEEWGYRELSKTELDNLSITFEVDRPKEYPLISSFEELLDLVSKFPTMQEGVVLVIEMPNGVIWRVKCKNPQYVAIAHMRNNGTLSPKNVLTLIMANEHMEYLRYFPEDEKYFTFAETIYLEVKQRITSVFAECKDIVEQKDYALTMMPKTKYTFEKGILFSMRKGGELNALLKEMDAKKLADGLNLKQKFIDGFHVEIKDEEL